MKNTVTDLYILHFNEKKDYNIHYDSTFFADKPNIPCQSSKYTSNKNTALITTKSINFHNEYTQEIFIPIDILSGKSALQAITVYLKDIQKMTFSEIARALNRDDRTIWCSYNSSNTKITNDTPNHDAAKKFVQEYSIPIHILANRNFSTLESIVYYLKSYYCIDFGTIAELLQKNYRTIWTVYKRALKKI